MNNPLVSKMIGSVVRSALLVGVGSWFINRGIWTEAQATEYMTAFAAVMVPAAWSLYEKYSSQKKLNTAVAVANNLTGPRVANVTVEDVEEVIKRGDAAPAMTSKAVPPPLKGTGDGISHIRSVVGGG